MSAGTLVFAGALVVSATGAFFSDVETSTANTFAAGSIDLQIDNESYALDFNIPGLSTTTAVGNLVANPHTSWSLADLEAGVHKFFDFLDVKPGDYGEDTISIHVNDNDAWLCAAARITADSDVNYAEPETPDDVTFDADNPGATNGELDEVIQFAFWRDDGDNVFEPVAGNAGVPETLFLSGPLSGLGAGGKIALSDTSVNSVFGANVPIPGDTTVYIGKMWCAGTLTPGTLVQDGSGDLISPLTGTGFTCDGSGVNNASQTDMVQGDMQFYAVQSRNNATFTCAADYTPTWAQ